MLRITRYCVKTEPEKSAEAVGHMIPKINWLSVDPRYVLYLLHVENRVGHSMGARVDYPFRSGHIFKKVNYFGFIACLFHGGTTLHARLMQH